MAWLLDEEAECGVEAECDIGAGTMFVTQGHHRAPPDQIEAKRNPLCPPLHASRQQRRWPPQSEPSCAAGQRRLLPRPCCSLCFLGGTLRRAPLSWPPPPPPDSWTCAAHSCRRPQCRPCCATTRASRARDACSRHNGNHRPAARRRCVWNWKRKELIDVLALFCDHEDKEQG
ncbi:hypothetical protein SORBI_3002G059800 [Sorghum bicolor]|uniref:Uncharacterized protein n=1 Tax=Sorghum bicolor TaxID=4558 RepID=A0A1B6Q9G8_SORBI|nr:hypothetical protein SORBI_3002G059800 [Sorghum bicolor]